MTLNGWQRLWVVLSVAWALAVSVFAFVQWPASNAISNEDIYPHLNPEHVGALRRYIAVDGFFGGVVPAKTPIDRLTPEAQEKLRNGTAKWIDPPPEWASTTIDIEGHKIGLDPIDEVARGFTADGKAESPKGAAQQAAFREALVADFTATLHALLAARRRSFLALMATAWVIPIAAAYAVGWAVAWIRRGFAR